MKYRPLAGVKYCLWQHEIPLRGMKYLPLVGMNVASRRRCKNGFALRPTMKSQQEKEKNWEKK